MLHDGGALGRAENRAREHADLALAVLESFPDGPARRALQGVPDLLISRSR
jgi:geranylgeranyl pyrophosphate synthase